MSATQAHKQDPVAKLYATALYQLAVDKNEVDKVKSDLQGVVEMFREQPQFVDALNSVMFSADERARLVTELTKASQVHPLVARTLEILVAKNRITHTAQVYEELRELVDQSANVMRGTVSTVEPLTAGELADLAKAFQKKFNKQVILEPVIDKEILGGLVVKVKGLTFDGSLKTTLRRLRENLERQSI